MKNLPLAQTLRGIARSGQAAFHGVDAATGILEGQRRQTAVGSDRGDTIKAMRVAFADRVPWMGDADFSHVPAKGLIDPAYSARRGAPFAARCPRIAR